MVVEFMRLDPDVAELRVLPIEELLAEKLSERESGVVP